MTRSLLPLALTAALGLGAIATFSSTSAAQDGTAEPIVQDAEAGDEENSLDASMQKLNAKMKALRKMLKPEKKDAGIEACIALEASILETLEFSPEPLKKLEGTDLLAYENEFKKGMVNVYTTVLELKLAIAEGDSSEAKALYRSLGAQKKKGHTVFIDGK